MDRERVSNSAARKCERRRSARGSGSIVVRGGEESIIPPGVFVCRAGSRTGEGAMEARGFVGLQGALREY